MKKLILMLISSLLGASLFSCRIPFAPPDINRPADNTIYQPSNNPPNPLNPAADGEPFQNRADAALPYDLSLDTIITATCPNALVINDVNFTLFAGSYFGEGLKLSDEFLRNNNISSKAPAERVLRLIQQSPLNTARARLALQNESNLGLVIARGSQPLQKLFPPFNNPSTLSHLSRLESVFTSRSLSRDNAETGGKFQAGLPISGEELLRFAPELGSDSIGNKLLTLTYTQDLRASVFNTASRRYYGKEYKLEFNNYNPGYLTNIEERSLSEPEKGSQGSWRCPAGLRFAIHYADTESESLFNSQRNYYEKNPNMNSALSGILDEGYCDTKSRVSLTRAEADFFKMVFGSSDSNRLPFYIGKTVVKRLSRTRNEDHIATVRTSQTCIIPKRQGCYLIGGQRPFVRFEFDPDKLSSCEGLYGRSLTPQDPERYKICPAFLSACYRYE